MPIVVTATTFLFSVFTREILQFGSLRAVTISANAGQDVRYAEAHYDRQNYAKIFEYAHSLSRIGSSHLRIDHLWVPKMPQESLP